MAIVTGCPDEWRMHDCSYNTHCRSRESPLTLWNFRSLVRISQVMSCFSSINAVKVSLWTSIIMWLSRKKSITVVLLHVFELTLLPPCCWLQEHYSQHLQSLHHKPSSFLEPRVFHTIYIYISSKLMSVKINKFIVAFRYHGHAW